jgi:hypothetical protein
MQLERFYQVGHATTSDSFRNLLLSVHRPNPGAAFSDRLPRRSMDFPSGAHHIPGADSRLENNLPLLPPARLHPGSDFPSLDLHLVPVPGANGEDEKSTQ